MSVPNPKRKCMTLEERVKCLKLLESGKSSRVVASEMCVGRTQVQNVLKRKREIMDEYESNGNLTLKRPKRETEYSELNDLVYRWFLDATARLVNVSGPMIQEKARNFARDLGCNEFKGSNGWLECFVKRNNIVFKTQVGERGEVSSASVKQWKEIIPEVCQGYAPENIFNMDETGLFYRDTTKSTYFKKGESCSGGKRSKQRITLALCASMTGEKLTPLVIGKSKKPRCFGRMSTDKLPVRYEANNKAWMLTPLMKDWLEKLDQKMGAQNRKILLLLDNAPVHPDITLRNVKLQFFPKNTTSVLQPMDAGLIQSVKLKYRRRQLQHVLFEIEKHTTKLGPEILRDITVLQAIYWISAAWKEVETSTIVKCFAKCGFTPESLSSTVIQFSDSSDLSDESDFDLDDECPLVVLKMANELFDCDFRDLVEIDQEFSTCDNDMTDWDRNATDILKDLEEEAQCEEEETDTEIQSEPIVTVSEVAECLRKLKDFAVDRNESPMLNMVMNFEDLFVQMRVESTEKQTKISDFFKK